MHTALRKWRLDENDRQVKSVIHIEVEGGRRPKSMWETECIHDPNFHVFPLPYPRPWTLPLSLITKPFLFKVTLEIDLGLMYLRQALCH